MLKKIYAGSTCKEKKKNEHIEVVGPIKFGDLLQDTNAGVDIAGIADGVFMQDNSVWPKEIIHAINSGLMVFGSSSMGAMRAAELDRYGMIGVGEIYELYKTGEVDGDDEVAILHNDQETEGLVNVSIALVNLRLSRRLMKIDSDKESMTEIISKAKTMPFWERTKNSLFSIANSLGASNYVKEAIIQAQSLGNNDQKFKDYLKLKCTVETINVYQYRYFIRLQKEQFLIEQAWAEYNLTGIIDTKIKNERILAIFEYMNNGIFITGTGIWRYIESLEGDLYNSETKLKSIIKQDLTYDLNAVIDNETVNLSKEIEHKVFVEMLKSMDKLRPTEGK